MRRTTCVAVCLPLSVSHTAAGAWHCRVVTPGTSLKLRAVFLQTLHKEYERLDEAIAANAGVPEIKAAFDAFWAVNDAHMKTEEDIMMPKVRPPSPVCA